MGADCPDPYDPAQQPALWASSQVARVHRDGSALVLPKTDATARAMRKQYVELALEQRAGLDARTIDARALLRGAVSDDVIRFLTNDHFTTGHEDSHMSTALAIRDNAAADDRRDDRPLAPMTFEHLVAMGDALVRTGFLPDHIKTGPQAAAIILTGQELGMSPMRSIRSLQMVKGKVVESADSQLARFKKDGGHAVFKQLDEHGAVLFLRHPNGDEHEELFTLEDARAAQLLGKDMYGKFLKAMLRSRAITAGLKSLGWEGGVGNYDPSEAMAFSGSSGSSSPSAQAPAPAFDPATMTLDEALSLTVPGKESSWGGHGGKPFRDVQSANVIVAIEKWMKGNIKEAAENGDTRFLDENRRVLRACELILEVKGRPEPKAKKAEAPAENATELAPGKVEDALSKPAAAVTELTKRITAAISNEKFGEDDRKILRGRLEKATSTEQLQALLADVEHELSLPF